MRGGRRRIGARSDCAGKKTETHPALTKKGKKIAKEEEATKRLSGLSARQSGKRGRGEEGKGSCLFPLLTQLQAPSKFDCEE